jgi:ribosomal protein S18 acetylase RimI-like enzyme
VSDLVKLLARIERTYDALPRRPGARAEMVGPFVVFVRENQGYPFYARLRLGTGAVSTEDVERVLARQRELAVPQAIEWVVEVTPALLAALPPRMSVIEAPLMVLAPTLLPAEPSTAAVRVLDPTDPDYADLVGLGDAVAHIAFGHPGTATGTAGPVERDAAVAPAAPPSPEAFATGIRVDAVVTDPVDGVVARGSYQAALGAAEIVGVATLPSARRRGHGAAVTAALARHAMARGNDLVFLSAADADVARTYSRIGFRRIGTAGIAATE